MSDVKCDLDLYHKLICALTHNMIVCEGCNKCKGNNFAEVRINLIKEIAKQNNFELPWEENDEEEI